MSAPTPPILKLPREISDLLFISASRNDLKNLSLVSRDFRPSAQRVLFHTVRLKLNLTSFANLISISNNTTLRRYVRRIEYSGPDGHNSRYDKNPVVTYEDWLHKYPAARNFNVQFGQEMKDIQSFDASRVLVIANPNLWARLYSYGQEYLEHGNHEKLLRAPLASLPGLSSLYCNRTLKPFEPFDGDPVTWTLLTMVLESSHLRGLQELHLVNQEHTDWMTRLPVLQNGSTDLKHLRSLTLEFRLRTNVPREFSKTCEFLSKLTSLRTLNISQDNFHFTWDIEFSLSSLFSPVQHWQKLKNLLLGGVVADYQHLVSVLTTHATSLSSLQLINMRLTSLHRDSGKPLSWIELFVFLNENMSLSHFTCTGWLETVHGGLEHSREELEAGHGEFWEARCDKSWWVPLVRPADHVDCLKYKIEQYVVHQGVFPFMARVAEDEPGLTGRPNLPWTWVEDKCFRWDALSYDEALMNLAD